MSIQDNIKNAIGTPLQTGQSNAPIFYQGRQKQHGAAATRAFVAENLQYASDFFEASCQGLDYDNFFEYKTVHVRLSDAISNTSLTNMSENYKQIMFAEPIEYFGLGAYINVCGNTYININASNISNVTPVATVRRCDALWRFFDYYGNIVSMPFVWAKLGALATQNSYRENMVVMDAYQHATIQLNAQTKWITENARVILGNQAYQVRGVQNFSQEFTADPDSARILSFDLMRVETNANDDLENKIADGLSFSWKIIIAGNDEMRTNGTQTLNVKSVRNDETPTEPYSYVWSTSDSEVLVVTDGVVTALSTGEAQVTCTLAQNENISTTFTIKVTEAPEVELVFNIAPQTELPQYTSTTFSASMVGADGTVAYKYSGAPTAAYSATEQDGIVTLTCLYPSENPLIVTAICGEYTAQATITLLAY